MQSLQQEKIGGERIWKENGEMVEREERFKREIKRINERDGERWDGKVQIQKI